MLNIIENFREFFGMGWVGLVYALHYIKINITYLYPTQLKISRCFIYVTRRRENFTPKKTVEKQVIIKRTRVSIKFDYDK